MTAAFFVNQPAGTARLHMCRLASGRIRRGWPSGYGYTHGGPASIPDRDGNPSRKLGTIAHGYNNKSHVEIVSDEVGPRFTIKLRNTTDQSDGTKTPYWRIRL